MSRVVAIVLTLIALRLVSSWGLRPKRHAGVRADEIRRFVSGLAVQMAPGSTMIAERTSSPGFLQFALLSGQKNWAEIEFGIPDIDWSANNFVTVSERLHKAGFHPAIEQGTGNVSRFLRVRIAGAPSDVAAKGQEIATVAIDALAWHDPTFTVRLEGGIRPSAQRGA